MREVEVKIIDIDRMKVEERLLSLGARRTFDGEMHDIYFDFPGRSISASRNLVRLRSRAGGAILAFKRFVDDDAAKIREEHEVTVSDFDTARTILEGLGLEAWLVLRKRRVTYELGEAHIDIDQYRDDFDFIPVFLEIEAEDADAVRRCAGLLGFGPDDCRAWTALDLAAHYAGGRRILPPVADAPSESGDAQSP